MKTDGRILCDLAPFPIPADRDYLLRVMKTGRQLNRLVKVSKHCYEIAPEKPGVKPFRIWTQY